MQLVPPLIDHECPNFSATSQIGQITLHDFIDDAWTVIFTCPSNFDPVHTSVRAGALRYDTARWLVCLVAA